MRCKTALTRVDALRTGELHDPEAGPVTEHLKTCRSCKASLSDLAALARVVKSLATAPPRSCLDTLSVADSFDRVADVWVAFSERGIRLIDRSSGLDEFRAKYARRYGRALERETIPERLRLQVLAALAGKGVDKPRVDLADASPLERDVLSALARIPRGEVRTYSWLAKQVGRPLAVRAVASVVARNFAPFVLPCHRVVPAAGGVGEYLFGGATKRDLLRKEGVAVDELDALGRKGVRFIGSRTTNIYCFPTCRDARRIREENRVPFQAAQQARELGFRPCLRCRPAAA